MTRFTFAALAGAILCAGLFLPTEAAACGGFFCSTTPIDQSGENIVFGVDGDKVEAHVQIQYAGEAEKFAWVVPLHAKPTLSIGSPALFTYLARATQPQFRLEWQSQCGGRWFDAVEESAPTSAGSEADAGSSGVVVVSREDVGPYDAAILTATSAEALTTWLTDNGYDLTASGEAAIEPYVQPGYYFVALKLQQNKGVGDLRPIVLNTEGNTPCVPIRLTAIAARPNMPIRAYVLSQKRAIPENYRHVLINETRIDWLSGGANYSQVASAAVDEAGGRAFLTEFAGPAADIAAGFRVSPYDTSRLAAIPHPVDFVEEVMMQGFQGDGSLMALFRKYIPMPASLQGSVDEQSFYNAIWNYRDDIDNDPGRMTFDAAGFAAELEELVVKPLLRSQQLLNAHPYLTRLFTTMSAEEMTVDPEFDFNSDAPAVSNVHTAYAWADSCEEDWRKRRVKIMLEDGTYFFTTRGDGAFNEGPNALRIEQYSNVGPASLVQDNSRAIRDVVMGAGGGVDGEGCGCTSGGLSSGFFALLGVIGLLRRGRKRRS